MIHNIQYNHFSLLHGRVSITGALTGITNNPPNLGGFLAFTDSIVSLILNSPSGTEKMAKVINSVQYYY